MTEEEIICIYPCWVCSWCDCKKEHNITEKTKKFIEKARKVHGYNFGYDKVDYKNNRIKVPMTCRLHGDFLQTPDGHINGKNGCPECSCQKGKPRATELNFKKQIEKFGSKVVGKFIKDKPVECLCIENHIYFALPMEVRLGGGKCTVCLARDPAEIAEEFRKRVEKVGLKPLRNYEGHNIYVECSCPFGHILFVYLSKLLEKGDSYICLYCYTEEHNPTKIKFEENIKKLGGIVIGKVTNNKTKVHCLCSKKHDCFPTPDNINNGGQGMCRICVGKDKETTKQNFIDTITRLGGVVKGEYKGNKVGIESICPFNHTCYPIPLNVGRGQGMCKICACHDVETAKNNFIQRIQELGGEVLGEYLYGIEPIRCICRNGHLCDPRPNYIQKGGGMCCICTQQGYSQAQISWLEWLMKEEKISIQHAENGGEFRIGKYKVDGYCKENNTVYEFHGDFWHGHPTVYKDQEELNSVSGKSYGQLFKNTLHKEMYIRRKGYKYVCIWECEWNLRQKAEKRKMELLENQK